MTRRPVQQRAKATVETIIEAGFICVARHGLQATTTRRIADVAGLGVGSVYEYFDNKEAIYKAMNRHFVAEVVGFVRPQIQALVRMEIADAVRHLIEGFEQLLRRDDERYLKFVRATLANTQAFDFAPVRDVLMDLLLQYVLRHPQMARLPDLAVMSHLLIHASVFIVVQHLSDENPAFSFTELGAGLARMVHHYVAMEIAALP